MKNSRNIGSAIVIISISFLCYFNSFTASFNFDDMSYIIADEALREKTDILSLISRTYISLGNRSIVHATLRLNYSIGGIDVFGYHVVNFIIHILTCLLIFFFVKETLSISQFPNNRPPRPSHLYKRSNFTLNIPLTAALIFAIHPMNTQAVTYISSRSSLMSTCFYIASVIFFIKGIRQYLLRKILYFVVSFALLIAGYGSKSIVVSAPIMFIISYFIYSPLTSTFLKRFFDSRFVRVLAQAIVISSPLILIYISGLLNLSVREIGEIMNFSILTEIVSKLSHILALANLSSYIYLLTEFKVITFYYIKMIFFPFNQNIDPDFPVAHGIIDPEVLLSLTIIIICLYAGIYFFRKNRLIAFGIFWFFVTLLPTSSFLPLQDTVTEHRLYLPLAGALVIIPVFIDQLVLVKQKSYLKQLACLMLFILLPIIALSMLTVNRNFAWKDLKSLWSDASKKSPRLKRPQFNLALAYGLEGDLFYKEKEYQKAIKTLNEAISLFPDTLKHSRIVEANLESNVVVQEIGPFKFYNNLGRIYGKIGQLDLAIENLKLALKSKPDYPKAHYNLGKVYELKGMLDSAIEEYAEAFKQKDDFFEACFNLANVYDIKGEYQISIGTYMKCLKLKSTYPKTHFAIGNIYAKTGKLDKAFKYYSNAIELDTDYFPAKVAIGNVLVMKGNFDEAEKTYLQVIESEPKNFNAHNSLGLLYLQQLNNPDQAVFHFKRSLKIKSGQKQVDLLLKLANKNLKK